MFDRDIGEASASQSLSRKDAKNDASGKNRSTEIHIENFDVSFGSKLVFILHYYILLFHKEACLCEVFLKVCNALKNVLITLEHSTTWRF